MSAIGKILLSPALALAGAFKKPKITVPDQRPLAQERPVSAVLDAVAARSGTRANQRSGMGGAEATGGRKSQLGA